MSDPVRLLFFAHALQSRGTERAIIRILRELDRTKIAPELAVVSATGDFLEDVPENVPLHRLGLEGGRTSGAVLRLDRVIRRVRPHIAVGVHTSSSRLIASLRLVHPRLPVVCFEADPFSRVERSKGMYGLRRALTTVSHAWLSTKVIAVSDYVAEDIKRELHVSEKKIVVIPIPSVEPAMASLAAEPVEEELFDAPVVISLGHLFEHKDQHTLIRSFAQVRKGREARLIMIGDGPLRKELQALAKDLGVDGDVVFLGYQKNPFRYLARAQVFVSPSASEGFDVSQVEAMACGTPVVVTDAPRFQAVTHEKNGLIVTPSDPGAMAEGIERILDNPDSARAMIDAGKEFASHLTAAKIARRWETEILNTVKRSAR